MQRDKKPTVFDRLGESKVSSTCDTNKPRPSPSPSSSKSTPEVAKDSNRSTVRKN